MLVGVAEVLGLLVYQHPLLAILAVMGAQVLLLQLAELLQPMLEVAAVALNTVRLRQVLAE
jgi:hypothetical protein